MSKFLLPDDKMNKVCSLHTRPCTRLLLSTRFWRARKSCHARAHGPQIDLLDTAPVCLTALAIARAVSPMEEVFRSKWLSPAGVDRPCATTRVVYMGGSISRSRVIKRVHPWWIEQNWVLRLIEEFYRQAVLQFALSLVRATVDISFGRARVTVLW